MKKIFLFLLPALLLLTACSESDNSSTEYDNWKARNEAAFLDTLRMATQTIAAAKAQWGENWEQHCDWRTLRSYTLGTGAQATWKDSVAVRVIRTGTGSGTPLYTDTVSVVYVGRLMPTPQTPSGLLFDHSPHVNSLTSGYRPELASPVRFAVGNLVEGFSTALQHMYIGDRWRVFMPADMAYGSRSVGKVIPHSMLVFDLELRAYWRAGTRPDLP